MFPKFLEARSCVTQLVIFNVDLTWGNDTTGNTFEALKAALRFYNTGLNLNTAPICWPSIVFPNLQSKQTCEAIIGLYTLQ